MGPETEKSASTTPSPPGDWSVERSIEHYRIGEWGRGYFTVNQQGHMGVLPDRDSPRPADLYEIVEGLRERGINPPVLLRFSHILEDRLRFLHDCFQKAIAENDYKGEYIAVYPTKVNEQRHVVESVFRTSRELGFGLEVGSLPELLAVIAMTAGENDRLIICNGFKGERFLRAVLMAAQLGRRIVAVVDSGEELYRLLRLADELEVRPTIGVRIKLSSQGTGRWRESAGTKAKFGVFISELLEIVDVLRGREMLDCLQLIHCHIGSQIEDIRAVKGAIDEFSRLFEELSRLGADLRYVDVGGGLGVDYDGSQTGHAPSINYTVWEYASSIVYRLTTVCQRAGLRPPAIVSESGRAMVAHKSVLIFDVIGTASVTRAAGQVPPLAEIEKRYETVPQPVRDLYDTLDFIEPGRVAENFHDATHAFDSALELFSLGYLPIEMRGLAERLYWICLQRINRILPELEEVPAELQGIPDALSEIYFGNFSLFQSLPDSWAISQVYPVVPLQRLDEEPTVRGIIADITCDSDGKIDKFIGDDGVQGTLDLHPVRSGEPYYLGVFLVGAYQEALGDLHNLFGDTNVAQVKVESDGSWWLEDAVEGDTSRQVLGYVQYDAEDLYSRVMRDCQTSIRDGRMTPAHSRRLLSFYKQQLDGYTYLE